MKENEIKYNDIKERIRKTADILNNFDGFLNETIDKIPGGKKISGEILGKMHEEAKTLAEVLNNTRPPRFLLVGKTGAGKSSLLNALLGYYAAEVSAVEVGTKKAHMVSLEKNGEKLMEIIDTRGIFESTPDGRDTSAKDLQKTIEHFEPDAAIFVFRAKDRAHLDIDVRLVKEKIAAGLAKVPVIVAVSQADELDPAREKKASEYSSDKMENIEKAVAQVKEVLDMTSLRYVDILPVSAYIEWDFASEPEKILFDGRYNIDKLLDLLENNMEVKAQIGLLLSTRSELALRKIAVMVVDTLSKIASTIALTPIPVADVFPLLALQTAMVTIVSYLAGRKGDFSGAKDFILSLGVVGVGGYTFRFIAQQFTKLIPMPGAASIISAGVAYTGTNAIGAAAIAYYFDKVADSDRLKEIVKDRMAKGK